MLYRLSYARYMHMLGTFTIFISHKTRMFIQKYTCDLNFVARFHKVIDWLLFNAKWTISQRYHGENKLVFNEMMIISVLWKSDIVHSASELKQQSTSNDVCQGLANRNFVLFDPIGGRSHHRKASQLHHRCG